VNTEIELKLGLPATALRQAERLAWLRKLAADVAPPKRLISDYYDTRKLKLRERGVSLRIRRIGSKRLQTIKGGSRAGALGRFEREDEITSKRQLRYGCDFFQSLFDHPKAQRRYAAALKELQGCLGKLNDIRVHAERARRLANPRTSEPARAQKAYAMGFLTGREQAAERRLLSAASKAGRKLAHSRRFW
jgi:hypothetical protein